MRLQQITCGHFTSDDWMLHNLLKTIELKN